MSSPGKPPLDFPPLPLDAWEDSKVTLHLFAQIVGKVRLALHPKLNHWWHVPLYVSARGLTTRPIPYGGEIFEIAFDFIDHALTIETSNGGVRQMPLGKLSVADFHARLFQDLGALGIEVRILARPYEHKSKEPFATDHRHASYDRAYVERYWRILLQVDSIFKEFSSRFVGKVTQSHLFWHSFDLALTRFSGRAAPPMAGGTKSDQEAYSHEVISFGFWPGDDKVREPAFYSYTYPEPAGLAEQPLEPAAAFWNVQQGNAMALLKYDDLRATADPSAVLLAFLESAYQAGARCAGWPIEDLRPR